MRKTHLLLFLSLIMTVPAFAQAPVISSVTPISTYPANTLLVTGSGFSSNPAQLKVWFDGVSGTILSSTDYSIQVTVPAEARLANIEVINLSTKLSAQSILKFTPSYSGTTFDPTQVTAPLSFSAADEVFDVCSCDLDGDGKVDLVGTKKGTATDMMILRNTSSLGSLGFASSTLSTTTPTFNITCGDLDGDGKPELVATRSGATGNEIYVYRNTGTPGTISFSPVIKLFLDAGQIGFHVNISDMDLDGHPEIVVSNSNNSLNNIVYVFVNQTSGGVLSFNATPVKVAITGASTTYGMEIQDLDGDQKPEIILNQFNTNDIFIVRNNSISGQVVFGSIQKVTVTGTLNHLTAADLNEDGKMDLAVTNSFSNNVLVLLNTSSGNTISFANPVSFATGDGPFGIDAADMDGDGDIDLVIGNVNLNLVSPTGVTVLVSNGNNNALSFTTTNISTGKNSRNIRVVDLDGDGKPDIANTTVAGNSLDIIRNKNCFVPQLLNLAPLSLCAGQTIRLQSVPGFGVTNYDWKESNVTVASGTNAYLDISAAGSYTVTATSEGGNCVTSSSTLVVSSGSGSIPAGDPATSITSNSPVCTGSTIQLNTPTVASVTYSWTGPNGFTSSAQNPAISNATLANAGVYSLVLSNGTCKTNAVTTQVDVADLASFSVASTVPSNAICQGSSLTLSTTSVANYTYQWIKDGVDMAGQTGTSVSVTLQAAYQVRVTNTVLGCSTTTAALNVAVWSLPVSAFSAKATACVNEVVTFTNQSTGDARGTLTSSWDFGDSGTSTTGSPTHAYTSAQTPTVVLSSGYVGMSACSSSVSHPIQVVDPVVPVISPASLSICPGDSQGLSITGTFNSANWSTGDTGNSTTITQPGTYTVNTVDQNSCASSAQIVVGSKPVPTITVTADLTVIAPGQSVQLLASGADTYSWTPTATLDNSTIANPKATPTATTLYTVVGTLTGGCSASNTINIKVSSDVSSLKIPNVFSPNGDGINDLWVIQGIDLFPDCTLSIFDQVGRRILEQKGYLNNWNGTYNGHELPAGTYYYVFGCPGEKPATGNVLIAR